ncbi:hypothetical protein J7L81_03315 [Candidatus Aerophobetes bacterium]|nr:hypothetical protein [Candidatus Aerophobetes bacterium]
MRKKLAGIVTGLFILSLFFSPGFATNFPRHKDPAQIKEETFFPFQLITFYAEVVRLQLEEKWDMASSKLKKILASYLPESVRYIFSHLNELIKAVGDKLREVEEEINSAQSFLKRGEIEKAEDTLEKAWMTLLKAERDMDSLNSSIDELKGKIGANAAQKLKEEILPLEKLARECEEKIKNLYRKIEERKRLKFTHLEISVAEKKVTVGKSFKIFGKLEAEGKEALGKRWVDIFLEDKKIFRVMTDKDGKFKADIIFPFLYKKYVPVFASYIPEGDDKEKFCPSSSNKVILEPFFYTPEIKVSCSEPVYPVLPFRLKGKVLLKDTALANYPVSVEIASNNTVSFLTDNRGEFQANLFLPPDAGEIFPLKIFTPPQGMIAPASFTLNIRVSYKKPFMLVNLPRALVLPFPLKITGKVYLKEGAVDVDGAEVKVISGKKETKAFVQRGSFNLRLHFPLSRFSGWEKIEFFLYPQKAWISSLNREQKILVVNPLTFLPLLGLFVLFVRISRRKGRQIEEVEEIKVPEEEGEGEVARRKSSRKKEMPTIARIYAEAVDFVAALTGVRQLPGHTIREYFYLVKDRLEKKKEDFEFISLIAERFLYSPKGISDTEQNKAERALERLKKQ